MYIILNWIWK